MGRVQVHSIVHFGVHLFWPDQAHLLAEEEQPDQAQWKQVQAKQVHLI